MHLHSECKGRSLGAHDANDPNDPSAQRPAPDARRRRSRRAVARPPPLHPAPAPAPAPRLVTVTDLFRLRELADPQLSPDGAWVAYTVTGADSAEDKQPGAVWMTSWDGTRTLRLTNSKQGESAPRWSPDGRWLAFLSSRDDDHTQLWLLDRRGGEGRKLTTLSSDVDDYV